ncbi:monovalent cation/H(+) antiporter subunit G [Devosia sediminis]|uniref:Na+/H+ antiporter subunit G n=1 Tax=Devosia sediminis TaxID=2798801 RepID=A0A934J040_9HYPH|nr:monovalent cation/H(+) antiporter subunit G [Devosia sediminis]MBJ3785144.1 Na+/H+ antiporter subunit G [Devosia sediminis]
MLTGLELYLGGVVLVLGAAFTLLAAIGVVRLPDLYTRMHAASKAGAVGGGLILVAVAVVSQDAAVATRAIIGVAFLLLTTPVSAHLLARASYLSRYKPGSQTLIDELASKNGQNPATE